MDLGKEMIKSIQIMVDRKLNNYKADRTYKTVIKRITKKGYVIADRTGCDRTVQCCIPGLELKEMQIVWVKEPMSDLKGIHICGVVEK